MRTGLTFIAALLALTGFALADGAGGGGAPGAQPEEAPRAKAAEGAQATAVDSLLMDVGEVLDDFLTPEPYFYQSSGLRDPFRSLLEDPDRTPEDGLVEVDDLIVVGILWGAQDRFALAQTSDGRSLILREGDRISNGRVVTIRMDSITVRVSHYGVVKMVTIPVTSGVDENDDR